MEPKSKKIRKEQDSFSVISLYLKGSLRRESLSENSTVESLLVEMESGKVQDEKKWADSLRKCLTWKSTRDLCDILARPLSAIELLFLFEGIEEFVQVTKGKVAAVVESVRDPQERMRAE